MSTTHIFITIQEFIVNYRKTMEIRHIYLKEEYSEKQLDFSSPVMRHAIKFLANKQESNRKDTDNFVPR